MGACLGTGVAAAANVRGGGMPSTLDVGGRGWPSEPEVGAAPLVPARRASAGAGEVLEPLEGSDSKAPEP